MFNAKKQKRGASLIVYGLIVVLIPVFILASIQEVGNDMEVFGVRWGGFMYSCINGRCLICYLDPL